jgi:hypothetical protein
LVPVGQNQSKSQAAIKKETGAFNKGKGNSIIVFMAQNSIFGLLSTKVKSLLLLYTMSQI